ncbi:uncharacterized protein METZ01_LOCUS167842 [marine metagenome]|uniref:Uncharacterized protein n=1 Tax=marine metagenome TaxID=408172 RepID=A0A382BMD8_9ZZZZ
MPQPGHYQYHNPMLGHGAEYCRIEIEIIQLGNQDGNLRNLLNALNNNP